MQLLPQTRQEKLEDYFTNWEYSIEQQEASLTKRRRKKALTNDIFNLPSNYIKQRTLYFQNCPALVYGILYEILYEI